MTTTPHTIRAMTKRLGVISFLLALMLPFVCDVGASFGKLVESSRQVASVRDLVQALRSSRPSVLSHYERTFPGSDRLVEAHGWLCLRVLGISSSDWVIRGKEGWMFYSPDGAPGQVAGSRPFTQDELIGWQNWVETRRNHFASNHIPYVLLIAPDKQTLYSTKLPTRLHANRGPARLDQFLDHMKRYSTVAVVDVRPALREGSEIRHTYHLTDSHWNDWGAFVAYQQVLRSVTNSFPAVQSLEADDYAFSTEARHGDLLMLCRVKHGMAEAAIRMDRRGGPTFTYVKGGGAARATHLVEEIMETKKDGGQLPVIALIRDSFGVPMIPFFAEHAARCVAILRRDGNLDQVMALQPSLVVEEVVERELRPTHELAPAATRMGDSSDSSQID